MNRPLRGPEVADFVFRPRNLLTSTRNISPVPEHVHDRDLMEHGRERAGHAPGRADTTGEELLIRCLDRLDGGSAIPLELRQ
jgi:hypothetical protein